MEKIIIVGAGLSGATVARLFAQAGYDVIIMDKRPCIGGNAYDVKDKNGIIIQPYGPHIFHTEHKKVFDFLSKFTEWIKYEHKVLASVRRDKLVPVPFNLTALESVFAKDKAERIKNILVEEIGMEKKVSILDLKKHANAEIRSFADYVYKYIFYIYTVKQWGFKPEQLGENVINRVPVHISYDDRYFTDEYQFMPKDGFTEMITNMLRHPHIKLKLGKDAKEEIALADGNVYFGGKKLEGMLIYTGCVDELFDYKYGLLPYRSLKFKFETKKQQSYQPSAVVNYTTSHSYTRISEFTKFTSEPRENTVIVKEYPKNFTKGKNIPYYPIPMEKNIKHYAQYVEEAKQYKDLYLLGRLATYKYINMDTAVKKAMELYETITGDTIETNND